jgi:hypothetical protein
MKVSNCGSTRKVGGKGGKEKYDNKKLWALKFVSLNSRKMPRWWDLRPRFLI